uniref:Asparagine synthetase B (Glutamine-hydrolyzing) n=1 Tax=Candidatus Kentrum sp. DK TaxID=2126562 RepID=A0A450T6B8_9GAMM|nr:MAG: Asparagine synthetase B (glutamine-hydrolyzing) [Candidatus Kentron sp. DK]
MCGILFAHHNGNTIVVQALKTHYQAMLDTIRYRGPDGINELREPNWLFIHSLLSLTGTRSQPVECGDWCFGYNGEFYDDWQNYDGDYGDADYFATRLREDGLDALARVDGEFSLCLFDRAQKRLYLATDPFGTKPLYYALSADYCLVGSYDATIQAADLPTEAVQVPANHLLEIDLKTYRLAASRLLRPFDFSNQTIDSLEPWQSAFEQAMRKRTANCREKLFVSLSSGHDSGLIAAELLANNTQFHIYSVPFAEVRETLDARLKILRQRGILCDSFDIGQKQASQMSEYLHRTLPFYSLKDPDDPTVHYQGSQDLRDVPGYLALAHICRRASDTGQRIYLSGQGVDEIYSDYFNSYTNSRRSVFRGNWTRMNGPWSNFYGGWNRLFLGGAERIAGHFGIESRYPFLDHAAVQAFLNQTPELKSHSYKYSLSQRLEWLRFPYHNRKIGFTGFSSTDYGYRTTE